jgi:hypothetical protein
MCKHRSRNVAKIIFQGPTCKHTSRNVAKIICYGMGLNQGPEGTRVCCLPLHHLLVVIHLSETLLIVHANSLQ